MALAELFDLLEAESAPELDDDPELVDTTRFRPCLAGHFPELPRGPASTPGYRVPKPELPPDKLSLPAGTEDLTGRTFVFLHVEGVANLGKGHGATWRCRCIAPSGPGGTECWGHRIANSYDLKHGQVKTCGCGSGKRIGTLMAVAAGKRAAAG